jgi:hypothetical protein
MTPQTRKDPTARPDRQSTGAGGMGMSARQTRGIEAVVARLLMAAVADTSEHVRRTVLKVSGDN